MGWLFALRLRPYVLLAAGSSLVLNLMLVMPAVYMMQVFDRVFASRSIETLAMLSALVALALALGYVMDATRARALAAAGALLDRHLSSAALHASLQRAAQPNCARDADSLRDIGALRAFLGGNAIFALFDAPWVPVYLFVIASMDWLLGAAAAAGAVLLFVLALLTDALTRGPAEEAQKRARELQRSAQTLLRHADAIAGMGMGEAAVKRWGVRQDDTLAIRSRLGECSARLAAAARVLRQGLQVALLGAGAWLVVSEHASPGIMVAASILFSRALQPVEQLIAGWRSLVEARAAWRRLAAPGSAPAANDKLALPAPQGRLEVERVVFAPSPERPPIIKGVSFSVAAGESIGLVGPSGSGKTTLLRLLLGIWVPQSGAVRLDGADIAQWDRSALGSHIGYLPQDVELFAGTVADNIARFGECDDAKIVEAAQLAHAHEMILRLPQGYDTPIGDAGTTLSGGQRQRIALARALYGAPRLVVLDEPNAHLDAEGEAALAAALQELKRRGSTVLVVSHRSGVMAQLDKVAVLRDGVLQAAGLASAIGTRLRPVARTASASDVALTPILQSAL